MARARRGVGLGTGSPACAAAARAAGRRGFDEVVVYWSEGEPGSRFWSDAEVHAEALTRLGKA